MTGSPATPLLWIALPRASPGGGFFVPEPALARTRRRASEKWESRARHDTRFAACRSAPHWRFRSTLRAPPSPRARASPRQRRRRRRRSALIRGYDPLIAGKALAANPNFYGGQRIELFGGATIGGKFVGLDDVSVAIEGGSVVYQNLNGPQLSKNWQAGMALRFKI
jgi:hypothetical protein